ncbi:MAG: DUF6115 domain-containing protein [Lachnospiraceae bacterium]|nr:DUF6115 domain-containing protein [Lachnospiraceae bacterium]MDD7627932.1 DUF6115 domain-containing protein [Lachnospiraceae bacterium]MDY4119713.1 DUF6115 domain-containing protein [Lachnospiraceae bacterium]
MNITELILLIFGGIVFTVSFFLPSGGKKEKDGISKADEEEIKEIIGREVEEAKTQISDIVDETITYSMEKTERSMERLTNEKIMAVNEYSDTVLEQINKNHKEAVFLYDMLNDKHENLKSTVSEAVKTASEVKKTVKDAEVTAREAKEQAVEIKEQIPAPVPEKEFVPIQAPRVEVTDGSATAEIEKEPEKPKRKTTRKVKPEASASKEEAVDPEKTEKASKVDLSMAAPGKTGGRNSNERILELHKAGKSNMAIAKELGLGIGEVKLVIDLFEGI